MACGCNKSVRKSVTSTRKTQPVRSRVERRVVPKNNGAKIIRRVLDRY